MSRSEAELQAPPARFFMELFTLACALSLVFVVAKAPLWVVYISPVVAVPLLLKALRQVDRGERFSTAKAGGHTGGEAKELDSRFEELRSAARRARSRRELENVRMRQMEFERSQIRYERWALGVGLGWALAGISLTVLAFALSWEGQLLLLALPAVALAIYLLKPRVFGEGHRVRPAVDREIEQELKLQEARIEEEPNLGSVHGGPQSSPTSRPDRF